MPLLAQQHCDEQHYGHFFTLAPLLLALKMSAQDGHSEEEEESMQVFYVHTFTVSPQVVGDLEEESSDTDQDDQASAWRQRGPDKRHDGTNQHDDDADAFLLHPSKRKSVQADSMVDRLCSGRWRPQVPLPSLAPPHP